MIEIRDFSYVLDREKGRGDSVESNGRNRAGSTLKKLLTDKKLLTNLNFDIASGEHLALVGPNGVGKTTLLRCLDFILTDWTGTILLDGRSIREIPRKELARRIAFIRQNPETFFDQTVRKLVTTGRYPYLTPLAPLSRKDEEIVENALFETQTEPLADRLLSTLSGGERQRVFLAAALAQEPSILLLDEPAAFLDYRHQSEMNRLLDGIRKRFGTTLVEVTHDLNRAVLSNAHAVALAEGGIVYDGPAEKMMNRETLRKIFQTELQLVEHPIHHKMMVIP